MAYNAVAQREHDALSDDANDSNASGSPPPQAPEFSFQPLSVDFSNMGGSLFMAKTTKLAEQTHPTAASAATSYDMLDSEDEEAYTAAQHRQRHADAQAPQQISTDRQPLGSPPLGDASEHSTNKNMTAWHGEDELVIVPRTASPEPMMRTASSEGSVNLQHPVPDLQSMQGAYVGNVERLERSAERLSMTSDINEELRKLKLEQKRSESRSSVRNSQYEESGGTSLPLATRKFSSNSVSNSIVGVNGAARSGGYSPGGWISSRGGSIRSGSFSQSSGLRLAQLPSQELDQDGGQLHPSVGVTIPSIPPPIPRHGSVTRQQDNVSLRNLESNHQATEFLAEPETTSTDPIRPATSASVDTFQQANSLFTDFDGVHFTPHLQDPSASAPGQSGTRRVSINHNPAARQSYAEPQADQKMVFYPAPVPAMLNLPKRLSKLPSATQREQREQRRTQVLDSIPPGARRSAVWLPGLEEASASAEDLTLEERRQSRHMDPRRSMANLASLPPQLRASVFFDQPATRQDIQVKEESAVATLDSILDASARAPVSAFTDHPIVGPVGAEVYGKEAAKKSTTNLLAGAGNLKKKGSKDELNQAGKTASRVSLGFFSKRRHSAEEEADEDDERIYGDDHPLSPGEEERLSEEGEDTGEGSGDDETDEEDNGPYFGAPTTLLAELQIRKQEQRLRNRTAANAFPNGMHSTLLELDAVAQVQQNSRRNKRVALAWEDPNIQRSDDEDDDDVPLAMLYADKINGYDEDRPLGLMEKREMEDSEPLSRRRDRLMGVTPARRGVSPNKGMHQLEVPRIPSRDGSADSGDEEEETLAVRIARLKSKGAATGDASSEFATDLISRFGGEKPNTGAGGDGAVGRGKERDSPDEETLGQRKKRLQAEREARAKEVASGDQSGLSKLKQRRSLADILQVHPVSSSRNVSSETPASGGAVEGGGLLHQHLKLQEQRNQQLREQNIISNTGGVMDAPLVSAGDVGAGMGSGGAVNSGLLYEHQQLKQQNAFMSTPQPNLNNHRSFAGGLYNNGSGGYVGSGMGMGGYGGYNSGMGMNTYGGGGVATTPMGYQNPAIGFNNGMNVGMHMNAYAQQPATGYGNQGSAMMQMGQQMAALDARQREMVERWRQSVMQ
ncbi:MAG: hypothetical protein M1839_008659 [Geoglossum umbratile]|nr:MAG: hypothetical protein M1839_008659 [Geoglossum umbratile]